MSYISDDSVPNSGPVSLLPGAPGNPPTSSRALYPLNVTDYDMPAEWQLPGSDARDTYSPDMNMDINPPCKEDIRCASYGQCGRKYSSGFCGLAGFAEDLDANAAALEASGHVAEAAALRAQASAYRASQAGEAIKITSAMTAAMPGGQGSVPSLVSAGGPDFGDILTSLLTGVGNAAKGVASSYAASQKTGVPLTIPDVRPAPAPAVPTLAIVAGLGLLAWFALK